MKGEKPYTKIEQAWLNMLVKKFQGKGLGVESLKAEFDKNFERAFLRNQFDIQRIRFLNKDGSVVIAFGLADRSNDFEVVI